MNTINKNHLRRGLSLVQIPVLALSLSFVSACDAEPEAIDTQADSLDAAEPVALDIPLECDDNLGDPLACDAWLADNVAPFERLESTNNIAHVDTEADDVTPDQVSPRGVKTVQVTCESWDYQPEICSMSNQVLYANLNNQLSKRSCSGRWGATSDSIYAFDGCRAIFSATIQTSSPTVNEIACSSWNHNYAECPVPAGISITGAWLKSRVSNSPCKSGTWGWDGSKIWVGSGCRGVFQYTAN